MRITLFKSLFLLFSVVLYAKPGDAQEVLNRQVKLDLRGITLKTAMERIETSVKVKFSYSRNMVNLDQEVNYIAKGEPLHVTLDGLLTPLSLTYKIIDEQILVFVAKKKSNTDRSEMNQAANGFSPNSQDVEVSGRVFSAVNNEPLDGVSIVEKGTGNGTQTDATGLFRLRVSNTNAVLVFSSVGYVSKTVSLAGQTSVTVSLLSNIKPQDEVIVVGYGRQRRRDITGSVASIKGEDLNNVPMATLDQKMQGQIAGVQVTQSSGNPGGGTTMRIRGQGTIGNNQPLFVIDGFPIVENSGFELNPLSTINPEDIESIEVLKDASSTAIYGSRGSNGVVLITTKKGRIGKPKVEFTASTGFQQIAKTIPVLNAREMAELYVEARNNGWNDRVDLRPANQTPEQYFATANASRGGFRIFNAFLDPAQYGEGTNWQNEIFRVASISNYQVNVSGGSDKVRYLFGAGYFDQQGIVLNSGFKRFAFRVNVDADLTSRIKAGINLAPSYVTSDIAQTQGHFNAGSIVTTSLTMSPLIPVYNPDGSYGHQMGRSDMNLATVFNPVALALEATRKRSAGRMLGNTYVDVQLARGLKFRTTAGIDFVSERGRNFLSSQWGAATPPPNNPTASSNATQSISWLNENTLTYQKRMGDHNVDAIAGFTAQKYNTERISNGRAILPNDLIPYVVGPSDQGQTVAEGFSLLSYLGRVNYSFLDRYLLTATVRRDGSSRFGANNRWGTFPSAALGWVVSEEKFMQKQKVFSQLKFRASYGVTGNYEIGNYAALALLEPGQYVGGTGLGTLNNVFNISSIGNPDLTWETSYKWNVGIDMSFVNNRIRVTADYYNNLTKDMLLFVSIPSSSGFTSALQNLGRVENKGWELAVNTQNIASAFKWSTNFNISANRNNVLDLGAFGTRIFAATGAAINDLTVTQVGQPMGQFFGLIRDGVFMTQAEADGYLNKNGTKIQPFAKAGDVKWRDVNDDGKIDAADKTLIGSPFPDFIFGLTNNFSWKGFELTVMLNGTKGNSVANLPLRWQTNMNANNTHHGLVRNRWRSEQDPGDGIIGRAILNPRNGGPDQFSSFYVEDASYIRIRNVVFAYNLSGKLLSRYGISVARVYVSGANLHTFTKYRGFDPETNERGNSAIAQGIDLGGYPLARTIQFGVNLTF